jgi:hypothetical protein
MESPRRIPHDDWADQDLLTRDEAAERLEAEIAAVREQIQAGDDSELLQRRLAGMQEALVHLRER